MQHDISATELTPVRVEPCGPGANVWLYRNIATTEVGTEDGLSQTMWEADFVTGLVGELPTAEEVAADFDAWWERLEEMGKTDRELIEEARAMAERAQAQADFTALMTDTEV